MNINTFSMDNLRTEIAILQEPVSAKNPGSAKFKIPILINESADAHIETGNRNIINAKRGTLHSSGIYSESTITLKIPTECTYFFEEDEVPIGTKFIIVFIGGNVNDIQIIGRYQ